eukprot:1876994-Alexandrium_andersonii.AAC.1
MRASPVWHDDLAAQIRDDLLRFRAPSAGASKPARADGGGKVPMIPLRLRVAPSAVGIACKVSCGVPEVAVGGWDPYPFACPGSCGRVFWADRKPQAAGAAWPKWKCDRCGTRRIGKGRCQLCHMFIKHCRCMPPFRPS